MEFYLLNYFKPATYERTPLTEIGRASMQQMGCTDCHRPSLVVERDRRVADVETVFDPARGGFNRLFSTATPLFNEVKDDAALPASAQAQRRTLRGTELLCRPEATRPGAGLLGTQLQRHDAEGIHDRAVVGRGNHGSVRSRRPQHQPERGDPAPRRRGTTRQRRLREITRSQSRWRCAAFWNRW